MCESNTDSQPSATTESRSETPQRPQSRVHRVLLVMVPLAIAVLAGGVGWGYFDVSGRIAQWMLPPLVPVSGQVYLNDEPLADAQIFAQAMNVKGANALGKTDTQGRFTLRTDVQGRFRPGVYVGEHRVMIIKPDPAIPPGPFKPPVITPPECSSFDTTPLRLRVERDPARNHVEFRLQNKAISRK